VFHHLGSSGFYAAGFGWELLIILDASLVLCYRYDHQERLTAQEAMAHPYFAPVRAAEASAGRS
jgi:hypothetical protein